MFRYLSGMIGALCCMVVCFNLLVALQSGKQPFANLPNVDQFAKQIISVLAGAQTIQANSLLAGKWVNAENTQDYSRWGQKVQGAVTQGWGQARQQIQGWVQGQQSTAGNVPVYQQIPKVMARYQQRLFILRSYPTPQKDQAVASLWE